MKVNWEASATDFTSEGECPICRRDIVLSMSICGKRTVFSSCAHLGKSALRLDSGDGDRIVTVFNEGTENTPVTG